MNKEKGKLVSPRKDDVVVPPRRDDVVAPPRKDDVVAPPRRDDVVAPPRRDDVVAPPRRDDVVAPPRNYNDPQGYNHSANTNNNNKSYNHNQSASTSNNNTTKDSEQIKTPKVGIMFYISGYLFWMILLFVLMGDLSVFGKLLVTVYTLVTNYTFCWFADYQRYKGGAAAVFFDRALTTSVSATTASGMNHTKETVTRSWTGGYNVSSRRSISQTLMTFLITFVVLEFFKLLINMPIALYSVFTHKKTLKKYTELVTERERYR